MAKILTNDVVEETVSIVDIIDAYEQTYKEDSDGVALSHPRIRVHSSTSREDEYHRFKTQGGVVPSSGCYAIRINSDIMRWRPKHGNTIQEKLPRAAGDRYAGFMMVFDTETGTPKAIVHDGYVQNLRVAATNVIAAKHLAPPDVDTLGLLGAGWQAEGQVAGHVEAFDLDSITVYSPPSEERRSFADRMESEHGVPVQPVSDPEAVFDADIVQTATNSRDPVFDVEWLDPGTHLGSVNDREIDSRALSVCDVTVVHSRQGCIDFWTRDVDTDDVAYLPDNDSQRADYATYDQYPELAELVGGQITGRQTDDEVTFFHNNVGIGEQFAPIGAIAYERAVEQDLGVDIPDELLTQDLVP
jgi:ornithine cyclodeaminase/alanine dehydrogenase-like protein (mu-crystallin family)